MRRYKEGCWGDGSFGHQHVRERLAALIDEFDEDIAEQLRAEMSDDAEEENVALEILNNNTSDENGLKVWEFVDGDLMLSRLVSENTGG